MTYGSALIAGGVTSPLQMAVIEPRGAQLMSLFGKRINLAATAPDNDKRLPSVARISEVGVKPPKIVVAASHHGGADMGLGVYESQYWGGYQYGNYGGVPYSTFYPSRPRPTHAAPHKYYHQRSQYSFAPTKYLWG